MPSAGNAIFSSGGAFGWLGYDGSQDGSVVNYSSVTNGSSGATRVCDVAVLSSSRAIYVCSDSANSYYGTAILLDISGSSPSVLDTLVFKSTNTTDTTRICKLDSEHALIIYDTSGTGEAAVVIDINSGSSDNLGLVGSEHAFTDPNNVDTTWDIDTIDSSNVLFAWRDHASPNNLEGMVLGVNTSTGAITENTVYTLSTTNPNQSSGLFVNVYESGKFTCHTNSASETALLVSATYSGTAISNINSITKSSSYLNPGRAFITSDNNYIIAPAIPNSSEEAGGVIVADHNSSTYALTNTGALGEAHSMRGMAVRMFNQGNVDYFLCVFPIGQNSNSNIALTKGQYLQGCSFDYSTGKFKRSENVVLLDSSGAESGQAWQAIERVANNKALIAIHKRTAPNVGSPYFYIANL